MHPVTLAESPNMPTVTAPTRPAGWNGAHVPLLSAPELAGYFTTSAAADPNGTWDDARIEYVGPAESGTAYGVIVMFSECGESDSISWECVDTDGRAWIDGLTWTDPITE